MTHNDPMGTGLKITLLIVAGVILYPILTPIVSFVIMCISFLVGIVIYGAIIIAGIWLIGYLFNQGRNYLKEENHKWHYKSSQEKSTNTKDQTE